MLFSWRGHLAGPRRACFKAKPSWMPSVEHPTIPGHTNTEWLRWARQVWGQVRETCGRKGRDTDEKDRWERLFEAGSGGGANGRSSLCVKMNQWDQTVVYLCVIFMQMRSWLEPLDSSSGGCQGSGRSPGCWGHSQTEAWTTGGHLGHKNTHGPESNSSSILSSLFHLHFIPLPIIFP